MSHQPSGICRCDGHLCQGWSPPILVALLVCFDPCFDLMSDLPLLFKIFRHNTHVWTGFDASHAGQCTIFAPGMPVCISTPLFDWSHALKWIYVSNITHEHEICNARTQGRRCGWHVLRLRPFRAFWIGCGLLNSWLPNRTCDLMPRHCKKQVNTTY